MWDIRVLVFALSRRFAKISVWIALNYEASERPNSAVGTSAVYLDMSSGGHGSVKATADVVTALLASLLAVLARVPDPRHVGPVLQHSLLFSVLAMLTGVSFCKRITAAIAFRRERLNAIAWEAPQP